MIERKHEIRAAPPPPGFVAGRIGKAAEAISRKGTLAARVELANEALSKATVMLYEEEAGRRCNVDATGIILIPLPWGSNGWRAWGLRYHEARTLRVIMAAPKPNRPPLYLYDEKARRWSLNVADYPVLPAAMFWVERNQITLNRWLDAVG